MKIRVVVVLAVCVLMVGTAAPQTVVHTDVRAVLQTVATAMGANNVKNILVTGAGTTRPFGQGFTGNDDWPVLDMPAYSRFVDYEGRIWREELTRRQGSNPARGGGGIPIQGDQRQIFVGNGNFAWNVAANDAVQPQAVDAAELRQIEIYLTPHGFIKGAMAAKDATAVTMMMSGDDGPIGKPAGPAGRKVTYIAYTALGKYKVSGSVDDQNLVERTQAWVPNPVMGDLIWQWDYIGYKDFAGMKYPGRLHVHWGDIRNAPHHGHNINVMDIKINVAAPAGVAVPDQVRTFKPAPVTVQSEQLAQGVWRIAGGSHHSVAVEFRDHIAVIEAPLNEARSLAVIQEAQRLIPNKPIRYLVVTHHHFDHSGGVRTYVAHGAIVVTHQASKDFFNDLVFYPYPRMMQPDILSTYYPRFGQDKFPTFETVQVQSANETRRKFVLGDETQAIELYPMMNLNHAGDMLIAYLPKEKILINADLYSPPAQGAPAPMPNQSMTSLRNNIQRLRLDVQRHVPIHGNVGTHEQFLSIVGRPSND
jgi:glyoxylase-like metal-dependent hydrolase (beta-lactamase superfamily II)